ncbi:PREDICTED: uncharacterized protein LOC109132056, partial [Camelina sativa]|uniref:Uncharacterized protein LOC109132056 n=1 Tax=Camelina sativa TaxID=90675 RepID=A0ABM1RI94_CAMSA
SLANLSTTGRNLALQKKFVSQRLLCLQRNATKRRALPLRTSVPCSMMESKLGKRFFSSVNVTRCLPKLVNV